MRLILRRDGKTVKEFRFTKGPVYIGRHVHSQVFLPLHVNLIRAGEISGQLDRVLARLAGFLEDDSAFRSRSSEDFCFSDISIADREEAMTFVWRKPKIVEIAVGMEINSYACAQL